MPSASPDPVVRLRSLMNVRAGRNRPRRAAAYCSGEPHGSRDPGLPTFPTKTGGWAGPAAEIRFSDGRHGHLDDRMSQSAGGKHAHRAVEPRATATDFMARYKNIKRHRHLL